jgi:hypothetical protein
MSQETTSNWRRSLTFLKDTLEDFALPEKKKRMNGIVDLFISQRDLQGKLSPPRKRLLRSHPPWQ